MAEDLFLNNVLLHYVIMSRRSLARTCNQNTALSFVAIKCAKTRSSLFGQILLN